MSFSKGVPVFQQSLLLAAPTISRSQRSSQYTYSVICPRAILYEQETFQIYPQTILDMFIWISVVLMLQEADITNTNISILPTGQTFMPTFEK